MTWTTYGTPTQRFCAKAIEAHRDKALGVKVRLTDVLADGGKNELPGLLRAPRGRHQARVPLVVHIPATRR